PSAAKLKQNITALTNAMQLIVKLKPKIYEYRQDGDYELMNLPKGTRYGLIAEEVEQVLPNLVKTTTFDVDMATHHKTKGKPVEGRAQQQAQSIDFKAVNYTELIPIVIKGLQELEAKTNEVENLKAAVDDLRERLSKLESLQSNSNTVTSIYSHFLEQNTPNPVRGTTAIRYRVGEQSTSARLEVTNVRGEVVKTQKLNKGIGQLNLNTTALAAGTYNYTLYVDGSPVDSKRLIIAH
ncbi:MAG TPA: tail fiber domain-containing protein, partial [Niastella sp.]|nr:tail fiber domain-containing protein [Niastella sp.]